MELIGARLGDHIDDSRIRSLVRHEEVHLKLELVDVRHREIERRFTQPRAPCCNSVDEIRRDTLGIATDVDRAASVTSLCRCAIAIRAGRRCLDTTGQYCQLEKVT